MVLVDPRMLESLRSSSSSPSSSGLVQPVVNQSLKELDGLMKEVLDSKDSNVGDKAQAYYQILRRYLHRVDQYKSQPVGTLKLENRSPDAGNNNNDDDDDDDSDHNKVTSAATVAKTERDVLDIIETLPKKFKEKGRWLLKKIASSSDVTWDSAGHLIVRGKRIKGSNITDLLHDVIRPRVKQTSPPKGWDDFAREIKRKNIPREFIGNTQRWNEIARLSSEEDLPIQTTDEEEGETFSTPVASKPKKKKTGASVIHSPWLSRFDD